MAVAMAWVSRITTISLEMVVPAVIGFWLDKRWGTKFLGLVLLAAGFSLGMWHLLQIATSPPNGSQSKKDDSP